MMYQDNNHLAIKAQRKPEHADLFGQFLSAWEDALCAYERLVTAGLDKNDRELSQSQEYRRFLHAGQQIYWMGGATTVARAAELIMRRVPHGLPESLDRLWCGLLPSHPQRPS